MLRVLVTGGAGFIGSHIVDRLLAEGHSVCVVDDLSTGLAGNVPKAVAFKQIDICNATALQDAVQSFKPELVYHLAAQMDVRRSVLDPEFDARVNVLGAMNVLRSAVAAGARRFIYASTGGAVYGNPTTLPVPETQPPKPVSEYGASKLAFEHYLSVYGNRKQSICRLAVFPTSSGAAQAARGRGGLVGDFTGQMSRGSGQEFAMEKDPRLPLRVYSGRSNMRAANGSSGVLPISAWGRGL